MSGNPWGTRPPLVAESKIFNAARRSVTLLVEAGFDERFWRMHCDASVRHANQGGRGSVLRELDRARLHPDAVLLAVLDADLDRVTNTLISRPDVVWTDAHDLETTLCSLPALEKLITHWVDSDKLTKQETLWNERLRARLFRHAEGLGRLRWLKLRAHPRLDRLVFKRKKKGELALFDRYDECREEHWAPSLLRSISTLINYSCALELQAASLAAECEQLPEADPAQVCNGHDLLGFLCAWLNTICNTKDGKHNVRQLSEELALACEGPWLAQTSMWQRILAWERDHPGHRVLKDP